MKKEYISPVVEIVTCVPATLIAVSPLSVENNNQVGEDYFSGTGDGEAVGAARGDWSGIWDGM